MIIVAKYRSLGDGNGGGGGRPLFPQWSHHVYPQFLPGSHPNANANVNANHHISQHHHQHPLPAARHTNRQPPSSYYLPNHYNNHPTNYNYHRHHHFHLNNNNHHHHALQKHNDQPRNLYHRNSGVGVQGNFDCSNVYHRMNNYRLSTAPHPFPLYSLGRDVVVNVILSFIALYWLFIVLVDPNFQFISSRI